MKASFDSASNPILPVLKTDIRRILIPTDFSEASHHAYLYALPLAQTLRAHITLLHVMDPTAMAPDPMLHTYVDQLRESRFQKVSENFSTWLLEADALGCAVLPETVTQEGHDVSSIVTYAEENAIDLIVMGTRGTESPGQSLHGSTVVRVVESSPCSVLAVPERSIWHTVSSVVYPMQLTMADVCLIPDIMRLASMMHARVLGLHVAVEGEVNAPEAAELLDAYMAEYPNFKMAYVPHMDVAVCIRQYIAEHGVSMALMPTTHLSWQEHLHAHTSHSITREVLLQSAVPVWAFHGAA
ncbi:MAG: universal stress protein [Bacteroidia bacterium]|nr:universal stress protein [Bacteroidia bacterium]